MRKKIAENTAVKDVLPISNPAIAEFGYDEMLAKLEKKHGKGKALSILAAKIGRAVYFMLKRNHPFDEKKSE